METEIRQCFLGSLQGKVISSSSLIPFFAHITVSLDSVFVCVYLSNHLWVPGGQGVGHFSSFLRGLAERLRNILELDGDVTGAPRVSQGPPSSDVAPQSTDVLGVANHCLALRAGAWAPSARREASPGCIGAHDPGLLHRGWCLNCCRESVLRCGAHPAHQWPQHPAYVKWFTGCHPCQNRPTNPKLPWPKTIQKRKVSNGILLNETVLKVTTYKSQRYGKEHTASDLDNYRAS